MEPYTSFMGWGFLAAIMKLQFFFLCVLTSLPNYSCHKILQKLFKPFLNTL